LKPVKLKNALNIHSLLAQGNSFLENITMPIAKIITDIN